MKGDFKNGGTSITIYSNYPDPIYAPPGKSVVVLHAYCDYDIWPKDQDEYLKMKDEKAWELIGLAGSVIPEILDKKNIEVMEVITPVTLEEFTMNYRGVVYGFYLTPEQWFERPSNQTPIDNLFIASNWCQYQGHGVGPNQLNGWAAARLIMDREGIE
jgi:phytoene dehydrogenase-like protein